MTTARELITGSLRLINSVQVNEVPSAADMDVSVEALNQLIDSKSNDLLNIHVINPKTYLLTPGQFKYSLGPTGDWVTERPMRIEQAKLMLNPQLPTYPSSNFDYTDSTLLETSQSTGTFNPAGTSNMFSLTYTALGFMVGKSSSFNQKAVFSSNGITWANDTTLLTYGQGLSGASDGTTALLGLNNYASNQVIRYTGTNAGSFVTLPVQGQVPHLAYTAAFGYIALSGYNPGIGDYTNSIMVSPSGTAGTWTATSLPVGMFKNKTGISAQVVGSNTVLHIFARDTSTLVNQVWFATNSVSSWTQGTIENISGTWRSPAYGNGVWVAGSLTSGLTTDDAKVAYSTDGVTWTSVSLAGPASTGKIVHVAFGSGRFVAIVANPVDVSGVSTIYTSTDGVTWTASGTLPDSLPVGLAFGNGTFVTAPATTSSPNNKSYVITFVDLTCGFTTDPLTSDAPLTLTVTSTCSPTPDSISWDFGNGETSTTTPATVTYADPGEYTITLTAVFGSNTLTASQQVLSYGELTPLQDGPDTLYLPLNSVNDEQFAEIRLRALVNKWPTTIFDNGGFPNRDLYFWPVPNSVQGVELWLWEPLSIYDLDAQLNLPPGYERYLRATLALELCMEFGKEPSKQLVKMAMEAEENLKSLNQQVPISHTRRMWRNKPVSNYITFTGGLDTLPEVS